MASSLYQGVGYDNAGWHGLGGCGATGETGMIIFGTVMGGASATLTGGNFWQGAATGLMVSALNHAQKHGEKQKAEKWLRDRFKNTKIDPDGKPTYTDDYLKMILDSGIEGLKEYWVESGKLGLQWGNIGADGLYVNGGKTITFGKNIYNNYKLVSAMFHEFRHAWQYNSGTLSIWIKKYSDFGAELLKEYDAYNFEMKMGNFDGSVVGWRDYYRNEFNNYIKK